MGWRLRGLATPLARALYSAALWLAQPLLRRKLQRRGRQEPGYLAHVPERFGHYSGPAQPGAVWVHAVSLGETRAAALLVARLRADHPGLPLLLTHSTATGRAEGAKLLAPGDQQVWLPWDTPGAVRRFLAHFQPSVGVLVETEVWPNLVHACQQRAVPLLLVNARLNAASARQAQRLSWLARPAYQGLTAVYAQTHADAERLVQLGAPVRGVLGNLKFDVPHRPGPWAKGRALKAALGDRPVAMWASSREGEEAAWLASPWREVAPAGQRPLWLVVPRHPQRFDTVADLLRTQGLRVWRRSAWGEGGAVDAGAAVALPDEALQADVWLGDSLGEMPLYYGLADLALLGGSFEPLGGQNLIEAVACDCPVVMGPHTFNFADAAEQAQACGAAVRVANVSAGMAQVQAWLANPAALGLARDRGYAWLKQGRGAAARYAQVVLQARTDRA